METHAAEGKKAVEWRKVLKRSAQIVGGLFLLLVLARVPAAMERKKTEEVVATIHADRIVMADVTGERLPPAPNPEEKDATVAGVDANHNGIRDDVELAIFAEYPGDDNVRIRAALLQYAKALQREVTQEFKSGGVAVAVAQEKGRASGCIADAIGIDEYGAVISFEDYFVKREKVLQKMQNTDERKYEVNTLYSRMESHGDLPVKDCDLTYE